MIMKKIVLLAEDVPTQLELQHGVSRLMKCYDLLKKFQGKNNTEDPKSMLSVAGFLDMLANREARNLRQGAYAIDAHIISLNDMFKTHLMSLSKEEANKILDSLREKINEESSGGHIPNI
jgi:hypothetical protein